MLSLSFIIKFCTISPLFSLILCVFSVIVSSASLKFFPRDVVYTHIVVANVSIVAFHHGDIFSIISFVIK